MTDSCFDLTYAGKVAHLRLNRPDAYNSMIREFWMELPRLIGEIDEKARARAIVISSTGKHFCAGMDLGVFSGDGIDTSSGDRGEPRSTELGRRRAQLFQTVKLLQDSFTSLERARVPVLAAIQGGCIGGAVDFVTACDMRYASADAFFCVQEINIGMTADVGTLQRLPKLIPEGIAREMAYRGHRLPARRACEVGLVNEVFDDHESLVAGVLDIAQEIASKSPLAVWGTKEMLNYTRDHTVADSLNFIAAWQSGMFQPHDMIESFTAKADKRDPDYDDVLPVPKGF